AAGGAIHPPAMTRATPAMRPTRSPCGSAFSARTDVNEMTVGIPDHELRPPGRRHGCGARFARAHGDEAIEDDARSGGFRDGPPGSEVVRPPVRRDRPTAGRLHVFEELHARAGRRA